MARHLTVSQSCLEKICLPFYVPTILSKSSVFDILHLATNVRRRNIKIRNSTAVVNQEKTMQAILLKRQYARTVKKQSYQMHR